LRVQGGEGVKSMRTGPQSHSLLESDDYVPSLFRGEVRKIGEGGLIQRFRRQQERASFGDVKQFQSRMIGVPKYVSVH